jgi:phosphoglycolate phosphatase-like HAD superfamily hydrolase
MTTATQQAINRIALVFDFDDTLAPDSFRSLLESIGLDEGTFRAERIQPLLHAGWESILARFYCLIEESRSRTKEKITAEHLARVGQATGFFDGVPEMFDRLRHCATAIVPDVAVEFYLLTSGFIEIPLATSIANEFHQMWGCEFHFDEQGGIAFPKLIVAHPEKMRYLLQLAKGLGGDGANDPTDVYRPVPEDEWHVPLNQMIYVGDGASDMPVFTFLHERQGLAIGVFKGESAADWDGLEEMHTDRRVQNLAAVDYGEESELMQSLTLAVESICKQIALRRLSAGE